VNIIGYNFPFIG